MQLRGSGGVKVRGGVEVREVLRLVLLHVVRRRVDLEVLVLIRPGHGGGGHGGGGGRAPRVLPGGGRGGGGRVVVRVRHGRETLQGGHGCSGGGGGVFVVRRGELGGQGGVAQH